MNIYFKKSCFLITLLVVCVLSFAVALAVPASIEPAEVVYPDGTKVDIYSYGDEYFGFIGDKDGYLLRQANDGTYFYADEGNNNLAVYSPTASRPSNAVAGFDLKQSQQASFSAAADDQFVSHSAEIWPEITHTNRKLLIVATQFTDTTFSNQYYSSQRIHDLYFSDDDDKLSLYNYYMESSGGKFAFEPAITSDDLGDFLVDSNLTDDMGFVGDGVIKVTLDYAHPNPYSGYSSGATPNYNAMKTIAKDSLIKANDYIDFSAFDTDNSDTLEMEELTVVFIVAGYERSQYASDNKSVWGRRTALLEALYLDDVQVVAQGFALFGAMRSSTVPVGIGVPAHELAHTLGLPDLYNVDDSSKNFSLTNYASLMDKGPYGRDVDNGGISGYLPVHPDAYCKYVLGWYDDDEIKVIDDTFVGNITLKAYTDGDDVPGYKLIRVNSTADPEEYFLLEYRKLQGFDKGLKMYGDYFRPGVAMWHVDTSITSVIRTNFNNSHECGVALLHSGIQVTGTDSSTGKPVTANFVEGRAGFYNSQNPFWSADANKFTFFGDNSFPNNGLNTANGSKTKTNVKIDFLSKSDADTAVLKFGGSDVNFLIRESYRVGCFYYFNNTDKAVTVWPYSASYSDSGISEVKRLSKGTSVPANGWAYQYGTLLFTPGVKHKVFNWDVNTMRPLSPIMEYTAS